MILKESYRSPVHKMIHTLRSILHYPLALTVRFWKFLYSNTGRLNKYDYSTNHNIDTDIIIGDVDNYLIKKEWTIKSSSTSDQAWRRKRRQMHIVADRNIKLQVHFLLEYILVPL